MTVQGSGMFIRVEVDDLAASDAELARKLESTCPVDIFAATEDGQVEVVERNVDECILCGLCLSVGPQGSIRVVKLYDNEAVLEAL